MKDSNNGLFLQYNFLGNEGIRLTQKQNHFLMGDNYYITTCSFESHDSDGDLDSCRKLSIVGQACQETLYKGKTNKESYWTEPCVQYLV